MKTYLLTNYQTGEAYVGTTHQRLIDRLYAHGSMANSGECDHTPLYKNMKEYGTSSFFIELLCEGDREEEFIAKLRPSLNG